MRFFTFAVVIERRTGEDEYAAYSPTLNGCFARGGTLEEARRNVREAVRRRLESLLAGGERVTQADDLRYVEQLTIGMPSSRGKGSSHPSARILSPREGP